MTDWSLHFHARDGDRMDGRVWDDAVKYRFIAAGWSPRATQEISKMTRGDRVWVRITYSSTEHRSSKPAGYAARGIIIRDPAPVARAVLVDAEGRDVPFVDMRDGMAGVWPAQTDDAYPIANHDDDHAEWVAAVRWEAVLDENVRVRANVIPSPVAATSCRTKAEHIVLLEEHLPITLDATDEVEWNGGAVVVRKGKSTPRGGDNSASEQAAVVAVTAWYEARGATVRPLPNDDLMGYDLDVIHHGKHLLVEVKGRSDGVAAPELENSQWKHVEGLNPAWRLAVVTYSTSIPLVQVWTAAQVSEFTTEVTRRRVWCID